MKINTFNVYRCLSCGRYKAVEEENYHPWCGCGYDQFDWNDGPQKVTKEIAEKFIEENE